MSNDWKAVVEEREWGGHGEGGRTLTLVIRLPFAVDCYSVTDEDRARVQELADEINALPRELAMEKERREFFERNVVWGFYEDAVPHFTQGGSDAKLIELHEPVTAEQCAEWVAKIDSLTSKGDIE